MLRDMVPEVPINVGVSTMAPPTLSDAYKVFTQRNVSKSPTFGGHEGCLRQVQVAFREHRLDDAIALLKEMERRTGRTPDVLSMLGQLHLLKHTREDTEQALRYIRTARDLEPGDVSIAFSLAFAHIDVSDWTGAAAVLTEIIALTSQLEVQAGAYFFLAYVQMVGGLGEEAVATYRKAIRLNPDDPVAALYLGKHLIDLAGVGPPEARGDRLEKALAVYEELLERDPDQVTALVNSGFILHSLQRFEESAEMARRAIALEPANAAAIVNLASSTLNVARRREDRLLLQQSLKFYERAAVALVEADAPAFFRAEVQHGLGLALVLLYLGSEGEERRADFLTAAESSFREGLAIDAERADLYSSLALVATLRGDAYGAINLYKQSLARSPGNDMAHRNLEALYSSMQASSADRSASGLVEPSIKKVPRFGSAGEVVRLDDSFDEPLEEFGSYL